MKEFFVGDFRVDMSRSQIVARENIVAVEPKALQVLLVLAEQQGSVVSHEELLRRVWPDVVVEANALQRCIALLRKAFGDDAKQQLFISTHPKVGYSLSAPVNWSDALATRKAKPSPKVLYLTIGFTVIALIALWFHFSESQKQALSFNRMAPLTATDPRELFPSISPDGLYIAFTRDISLCERELWARDLSDGRELKLSDRRGPFTDLAWSPDSSKIAYAVANGCGVPAPEASCASLRSVNFFLGRANAESDRELVSCGSERYSDLQWLDNSELIYIASQGRKQELRVYSESTKAERVFETNEIINPHSLSYHYKSERLAIAQAESGQAPRLIIFARDGSLAQSSELISPPGFSSERYWRISWHPNGEKLITSSANRLFEINLNGAFSELYVPSNEHIFMPKYYPSGDRVVASMGIMDIDFYRFDWREANDENHSALHRSTLLDISPKFQPGSANVAFISGRSGTEQLWYQDHNKLRQLSHFEDGGLLSFVWSPNGDFIAVVAHEALALIEVGEFKQKPLGLPFKVLEVLQWKDDDLLLRAVLEGEEVLLSLRVDTLTYSVLRKESFVWAQWAVDGTLFVTNAEAEMELHSGESSIARYENLAARIVPRKFIAKPDGLLFFDQSRNVWLYHFNVQSFEKVADNEQLNRIYDIEDFDLESGRLLYSGIHNARKEIVIFYND